MRLPPLAPAPPWCDRCEVEPATAGGILCSPCRTIVLAFDVLDGDGTYELIELEAVR